MHFKRFRPARLILCFVFFILESTLCQPVKFSLTPHQSCSHERPHCVSVTVCASAKKDIGRRRNPTICGWVSDVPLVCCAEEVNTFTPKTTGGNVSKLSPTGCGIKISPSSEVDYAIRYPDDAEFGVLESGIEPRSGKGSRLVPDSFYPVPTLPSDTTFSFLAVGGVTAALKWPWMVAIFNGNLKKQLCGGTLIDERHILTAAHCFVGKSHDPSRYKVQIGELILNEANKNYDIDRMEIHEDYSARYYYHDIAILRLTEPLTDYTAACLPAEDDVKPGENVTVLGWGDLSFGGPSTTKLQEVANIPVVGNAACDSKFRALAGAPFPQGITKAFLCAGFEEGQKDACQGDSGGPLLMEHSKDTWSLVGIVSFGYKCGEPGYPGVYTKVSAYLKWIEQFIGNQNEVVMEKQAKSANFEYIDGKPLWKSFPERTSFHK